MRGSNQTGSTMERCCHRCGADIGAVERVGRRDACLRCGADLHCCLNCAFYDPTYHNHCLEQQAERQVDKQAGNFCDFFAFRRGAARPGTRPTGDARAHLDSLFKKKST
jgi:hypothetical protein